MRRKLCMLLCGRSAIINPKVGERESWVCTYHLINSANIYQLCIQGGRGLNRRQPDHDGRSFPRETGDAQFTRQLRTQTLKSRYQLLQLTGALPSRKGLLVSAGGDSPDVSSGAGVLTGSFFRLGGSGPNPFFGLAPLILCFSLFPFRPRSIVLSLRLRGCHVTTIPLRTHTRTLYYAQTSSASRCSWSRSRISSQRGEEQTLHYTIVASNTLQRLVSLAKSINEGWRTNDWP